MIAKEKPLIWQRMQVARGGRVLSYPAIVRAAMRVADRGGLAAVTMRDVAAALGSGTMSLYRYVEGKDDLLDLILDAAYGEIELPARPAGWWQCFRQVGVGTRRMLLRHPWIAVLVTCRPTLGPNYLRWFETMLAATEGEGRAMRTRLRMIGTFWAYIAGFAAYEAGEKENRRRHKLSEAAMRKLVAPYLEGVFSGGEFPHLQAFLKSGSSNPTDADFRAGMDAVIAGLEFL